MYSHNAYHQKALAESEVNIVNNVRMNPSKPPFTEITCNFSPYIISYMRQRTGETTLRNVDGVWVSSFGTIFSCFGMTLGGLIERRFGPRLATAGGCIFFTACVGCSALTIQHSFILFTVSYGACSGIATFMVYGPPIATAIKWFPNRRAMVAGCVLCGFGGSSIIFNQVITGYINPDNLSPEIITEDGERYFGDPELLDRVPLCFLVLGGICASMEIIGCLLITLPPKLEDDILVVTNLEFGTTEKNVSKVSDSVATEQQEERGGRKETSIHCTSLDNQGKVGEKVNADRPVDQLTVRENLKLLLQSRQFYILWLTVLSIDSGMTFVSGLYKAYGQTFIKDDHFLALVGSCSSVFNCLGRPAWGAVMDRFGFKVTIRCISVGLSCVVLTLLATEQLGKAAFFVWVCLAFFCFCGLWACLPSAISGLYGTRNMATNYGFVNTANAAAGIIGAVSAVTLKDIIGWHGMFFLSGSLPALCLFWTISFKGTDESGKRI